MLLIAYKKDPPARVGKGDFATVVAATEFVLPWTKGMLLWSKAVLEGWAISGPVHHALPMPDPMMVIIACVWWVAGFKRLARGLWLQKRLGLRPGELLGLQARDVLLPEDLESSVYTHGILNLGARTGTKLKRAQAVLLAPDSFELLLARQLRDRLEPAAYMFGAANYGFYNGLLSKTCPELEILPYRAHSPRAGHATDAWLQGEDFVKIRERLRHMNDRSLKVCLTVCPRTLLSRGRSASTGAVPRTPSGPRSSWPWKQEPRDALQRRRLKTGARCRDLDFQTAGPEMSL